MRPAPAARVAVAPPGSVLIQLPLPKPPLVPAAPERAVAVMADAIVPAPVLAAAVPAAAAPDAPRPAAVPIAAAPAPAASASVPAAPGEPPAGNGADTEVSGTVVPAMAPPVAMVGSPLVLGEIADRIPRRYGGRTLLDLVLLMIPVAGTISACACLYWAVGWYLDHRRRARRRRAAARLGAARRRAVAAAGSFHSPGHAG